MSATGNKRVELAFETVALPEVTLNLRDSVRSDISHLLERKQVLKPTYFEEVPGRRRYKARIAHISNDEKILLTQKKNECASSDFSAILYQNGGCSSWLHHAHILQCQTILDGNDPQELREGVRESWIDRFRFKNVEKGTDGLGLRTPQIGALHALSAHWTLSTEAATVVMPTGTGKTETMLSLLISEACKCMLVVVPSKALRDQTVRKFVNLGILPDHGVVSPGFRYPIVGTLKKRPKCAEDTRIFDKCNVVVAVINTIAFRGFRQILPWHGAGLEEVKTGFRHLTCRETGSDSCTTRNRKNRSYTRDYIYHRLSRPFPPDDNRSAAYLLGGLGRSVLHGHPSGTYP